MRGPGQSRDREAP